jgi:serine/threonine protein kinase, bacterial
MGERLGEYELISLMSVGGMAELHLASTVSKHARKPVALKLVLPQAKDDPDATARFLDEAKLMVSLAHPNIAQVFELGESEGQLYLAMEFITGVDLWRLTQGEGGQVPEGFAARIGHDVAAALAYAHDDIDPITGMPRGVVHRDLTPRNVMLTFDGGVRVIDFGLARFRGRVARTAVGQVRGTAQYMAPEQLRGEAVDGRTDLYALGMLLWELLSGRTLVPGGREEMLERVARNEGAPPLASVLPDVKPALARIVDTLLDPRPAARFQSARELQRALSKLELFDEERMATLLSYRCPETKRVLTRLASLSSALQLDEAAIATELKALRNADRPRVAPASGLSEARSPSALPEFSFDKVVLLVAVSIVLVGALLFLLRQPETLPVPMASPRAVLTSRFARKALADGMPLEASRFLSECLDFGVPCAGLDDLRADTRAVLTRSVCGDETRARELIVRAAREPMKERTRLLETCRAGRVLHPLAALELQRLAFGEDDAGP